MKVAVVGGKLQGVEVTYLAKCAGYTVGILDKRQDAQAFGMADKEHVLDILKEREQVECILKEYDVVIPAMENLEVLDVVLAIGEKLKIPVLFDRNAYEISSSKQASNQLFRRLQLPMPGTYPHCSYPVILKPNDQSGSTGVQMAFSKEEAEKCLKILPENMVAQEYLEGRSFSLEVLGDGTQFRFPQITEVVVDKAYDCKRIIAPAKLQKEEAAQLFFIGRKLAEALKIKGIFDIEVICHNGTLKLLEIDARVPSQTPISVYHSCGFNMIEAMIQLALGNPVCEEMEEKQVVMYQQIVVTGHDIKVLGEHVMGDCKRLHRDKAFFGALDAITDYEPGRERFSAIVITAGNTQEAAYEHFINCVTRISDTVGKPLALIEG